MSIQKKIKNIITGFIKTKSLLIPVIIFFIYSKSFAATLPSVTAKADTNQIRIGEQFHLNLSALISKGTKINFPQLTDTFNHFEIVNKSAIDTSASKDNNQLTLRQQLTLTSFDSGFFVVPPMPFVVSDNSGKSDTILTEALLMTVQTVPIDTTKEIRIIKGIIDVPFPWMEYSLYALIALAVVALVIYLYMRYKKREIKIFTPKIPDRPAHEIALEGLKRIEAEKLWQQGFTKRYFSEVTDILRQYIERRFSVNAMEQTTDEILNSFRNGFIQDEENEKLRYILRLADMVKFAKALPLPSENESTMQFSYLFINNTRPVIKEDIEKKEEQP